MNKQDQMILELKKTETLQDLFDVFEKYYDTKNTKLGIGAKTTLLLNLPKLITATGAKLKP